MNIHNADTTQMNTFEVVQDNSNTENMQLHGTQVSERTETKASRGLVLKQQQ